MQWRPLCTITASTRRHLPPQRAHLVTRRVSRRASGSTATPSRPIADVGPQPALYAYSDMGMFNNGSGTFYLAEVAPTLRRARCSPSTCGTRATSAPARRRSTRRCRRSPRPAPVADAPVDLHLHVVAGPEPRAHRDARPGGPTGVQIAAAHVSDQRHQVRHRHRAVRDVPAVQRRVAPHPDPDPGRLHLHRSGCNPETTAGSCWWGIQYAFSAQPYDVTTWKARIEGNPVHLTQVGVPVYVGLPGRAHRVSLRRCPSSSTSAASMSRAATVAPAACRSAARPTAQGRARRRRRWSRRRRRPRRRPQRRLADRVQGPPPSGRRRAASTARARRKHGARGDAARGARPRGHRGEGPGRRACWPTSSTPATAGWPPRAARAAGATPASCRTAAAPPPSPSRARWARSAGCGSSSSSWPTSPSSASRAWASPP